MTGLGDERAAERGTALGAQLAGEGIRGVQLTIVDNSGIARVKGIPVAKLGEASTWGVGMSPVFDAFLLDDSITASASAGGPVGDLRLVPDLDALVCLAAQPGWAWAPVDRWRQDGHRHPQCQRALVRRLVTRAADQGLALQMGFEVEWMLSLGLDDAFVPATTAPAYGAGRFVDLSGQLIDVLDALTAQGIEVEQVHPEYAPGQFELSIAHAEPLAAADRNVLVRQTVRAVARAHGMRATFAPSVLPGGVGNGAHLHLSLWRDGHDLCAGGDGPYGLTDDAQAFLAGVLRALPALLAIGAPSVASYQRLVPQHWSGDYRCWGLENREAALRLVAGPVGATTWTANAEVKSLDATASPYLVVAGVIAAGLAGVEERLRLPPEVAVDPGGLSDAELEARGIERLPTTLGESTAAFAADAVLAEAFGAELHETIIAVRGAEIALFADASPTEIVDRTRWRH